MGKLVFLTGCGRSGTTILGQLLEQHPDVVYLNDRFDVWVDVLPIADIWGMSRYENGRTGKVGLTARDVDETGVLDAIEIIRTRLEDVRGGAPVLVEKLAINNFRLGFLHAAFPEASFINISRHGVEVAASIARKIEQGEWYGDGDRKWDYLCEYAGAIGLGPLAHTCRTPLQRGLLEWRMSVESAEGSFSMNPDVDVLRVSYEQLISDPPSMAGRLSAFLRLPPDDAMRDWADTSIARRSAPAFAVDAATRADAERIAGDTIRQLGYTLDTHSGVCTAREGELR